MAATELSLIELKFSWNVSLSILNVTAPVLVIQFVEVFHNLDHRLSFCLWDENDQECCTEEAVGHKDQEAELTESILCGWMWNRLVLDDGNTKIEVQCSVDKTIKEFKRF